MKFVRPLVIISGVLAVHAALLAMVLQGSVPVPPPMEPPRITGVLISASPALAMQIPAAKPVEPEPVTPPVPAPKPKQQPPKPTPPKPVLPKPRPRPAAVAPTLPRPKPAEPRAEQPALPIPVQKNAPAAQPVTQPATTKADSNNTLGAPVTPPRIDATQRSNPAPAYPPVSRRRREEGKVVLELLVKADGTVADVTIKQSSGYSRLDKAALEAVRRWRYTPAKQGGKPIAFRYLQPITFGLREH